MAQDFKVNTAVIDKVEIASWVFNKHSRNLDLNDLFNEQKVHTWFARVMDMADWSILEALRGQQVSLTTTNHEDRNASDYRLYPDTILIRVDGEHAAQHMQDVEVEFRVL